MVKVMNVVFGIGIAIVLYLVVLLGIKAFYAEPMIDDFNCTSYSYPIYQQTPCDSNMTIEQCNNKTKFDEAAINQKTREYDDCYKKFDKVDRVYGKNVFIISAIIGTILIVVSYFLFSMVNISAGVALSGISLIIYGFARGWSSSGNMIKFIIGLIAAIVIFVFAVIVNKRSSKTK